MAEEPKNIDEEFEQEVNMAYWNKLERTEPRFTKKMDTGAKLTSINPEWQVKKFTELFGPIGIGWGYTIIDSQIVNGGPMMKVINNEDVNFGPEKVHTLRLHLWYVDPESGERSALIETTGHTPFVYLTSYGPKTDQEYEKKSITDAMTKAMSLLGMGGDVRMGLFDDSDYVQDAEREEAIDQAVDREAALIEQRQEFEEWYGKNLTLMQTSNTLHEIEIIWKAGRIRVDKQGTKDQLEIFDQCKTDRVLEIVKKQKEDEAAEADLKQQARVKE